MAHVRGGRGRELGARIRVGKRGFLKALHVKSNRCFHALLLLGGAAGVHRSLGFHRLSNGGGQVVGLVIQDHVLKLAVVGVAVERGIEEPAVRNHSHVAHGTRIRECAQVAQRTGQEAVRSIIVDEIGEPRLRGEFGCGVRVEPVHPGNQVAVFWRKTQVAQMVVKDIVRAEFSRGVFLEESVGRHNGQLPSSWYDGERNVVLSEA